MFLYRCLLFILLLFPWKRRSLVYEPTFNRTSHDKHDPSSFICNICLIFLRKLRHVSASNSWFIYFTGRHWTHHENVYLQPVLILTEESLNASVTHCIHHRFTGSRVCSVTSCLQPLNPPSEDETTGSDRFDSVWRAPVVMTRSDQSGGGNRLMVTTVTELPECT